MRSSVQLLVLLREPRFNLYNPIVLKYLKFRNLTFTKLKVVLCSYLFDLIQKSSHMYNTYSLEDIAKFYSRTGIFKYSFLPSTLSVLNKLDSKMQQSKTLLTFQNAVIKTGKPIPNPIYHVHNSVWFKVTYQVVTWSQSSKSAHVQSQFPRFTKSIVFV